MSISKIKLETISAFKIVKESVILVYIYIYYHIIEHHKFHIHISKKRKIVHAKAILDERERERCSRFRADAIYRRISSKIQRETLRTDRNAHLKTRTNYDLTTCPPSYTNMRTRSPS